MYWSSSKAIAINEHQTYVRFAAREWSWIDAFDGSKASNDRECPFFARHSQTSRNLVFILKCGWNVSCFCNDQIICLCHLAGTAVEYFAWNTQKRWKNSYFFASSVLVDCFSSLICIQSSRAIRCVVHSCPIRGTGWLFRRQRRINANLKPIRVRTITFPHNGHMHCRCSQFSFFPNSACACMRLSASAIQLVCVYIILTCCCQHRS